MTVKQSLIRASEKLLSDKQAELAELQFGLSQCQPVIDKLQRLEADMDNKWGAYRHTEERRLSTLSKTASEISGPALAGDKFSAAVKKLLAPFFQPSKEEIHSKEAYERAEKDFKDFSDLLPPTLHEMMRRADFIRSDVRMFKSRIERLKTEPAFVRSLAKAHRDNENARKYRANIQHRAEKAVEEWKKKAGL